MPEESQVPRHEVGRMAVHAGRCESGPHGVGGFRSGSLQFPVGADALDNQHFSIEGGFDGKTFVPIRDADGEDIGEQPIEPGRAVPIPADTFHYPFFRLVFPHAEQEKRLIAVFLRA